MCLIKIIEFYISFPFALIDENGEKTAF